MDNQRLILFVALAAIIVMIWSSWEAQNRPPVSPPVTAQSTAVPDAPATPGAPAAVTPQAASTLLASGQRIDVKTDLFKAVIDTQGGDLRVVELLKYPVSISEPASPLRLLDDQGPQVFVAQSGLISLTGNLPTHKSLYRAEATHYSLDPDHNTLAVTLRWDSPSGVHVTKTYTFHRNEYQIDVSYEVTNDSRQPSAVYLYAQWLRQHVDEKRGLTTLPSYTGGVIYTDDKKYEKIDFDSIKKHKLERDVNGGWVAMIQHYFVGAWIPPSGEHHQFYTDTANDNFYFLGYKTLQPVNVAPGAKAVLATQLYVGPKEHKRLPAVAPGLELTVDYGWLTFIAAPLFLVLRWIHNLIGNWGWAIIVLTLLIKIVFYPLSVASYRSMAKMRKLAPRLEALKKRYADDKQQLHQAMMEMYKTEKINPLGGCLPILIQIPVFISLYWVLLESVELRQAPWAFWIHDLSAPDPFFVLPVLMGISMLVQQWLNPQPLEDLQKKLMYALPVVFTFMFLWFPAGLVLYWVVQNVLSIAQQWSINRTITGKP